MTSTETPAAEATVATVQAVRLEPLPGSWVRENLRSILALVMTLAVIYLALRGIEAAMAGLIGAWGALVGTLFGERSALKQPGVDR
jgi:thiol:disulfide interchange protein